MNSIIAIVTGVGAIVAAFIWAIISGGKRGRKQAEDEQRIEDLENAETIRRRADDADKLLRDHDDAGWRD